MFSGLLKEIELVRSWFRSELGQEFTEASMFALLITLIGMATIEPISELFSTVLRYWAKFS